MQKLTRYYITKSGEEPTVHRVKVALATSGSDDRSHPVMVAPIETPAPEGEPLGHAGREKVSRLVRNAMRKRVSKP